ncbi:MAG: NUDIX hydrolase [Planctomycetota bacterium]|nr:MAG: NUDIX hydrolase [Planctomycetota bacterium]
MRPLTLEILEDRSAQARCDEGFLRLRRLRLRHRYDDGSASPPYDCDLVSRRSVDAVAVVLWRRAADGRVQVLLKEGVRPPIWLRRHKELVRPDPEAPLVLAEIVAGMLEPEDAGGDAMRRRARIECREEAGVDLPLAAFQPLGGHSFPSPGITDERVDYYHAELDTLPDRESPALGDGSGMEHGTRLLVLDLDEAIQRCRDGSIPDMKTEVALCRLSEALRGAR